LQLSNLYIILGVFELLSMMAPQKEVTQVRSTPFKLDHAMKPSITMGRGLSDEDLVIAVASLALSPKEQSVKSVLLKVKAQATYEENVKALGTCDAKSLSDTLDFLDKSAATGKISLLKDGKIFLVLRNIVRMMPYKCGVCTQTVKNADSPAVCCKGCGTGACSNCFDEPPAAGFIFLCPPCSGVLDARFKLPDAFRSRSKKKGLSISQEPSQDQEQSQSQSQTLSQILASPTLEETPDESESVLEDEVAEVEEISPVVSGDDVAEDGDKVFSEPSGRLRKKAKAAAKADAKSDVCKHFLQGNCKHGFFGRVPKDGKDKCPFDHPKTCKKLLDNGTGVGGCSKGKKCLLAHPRMCASSVATRTCIKLSGGGRCFQGYHVRGTKASLIAKPALEVAAAAAVAVPTASQPQHPLIQQQSDVGSTIRSVFGETIREIFLEMIRDTRAHPPWRQEVAQVVPAAQLPPVTSKPQQQEGLQLLLSLLGTGQRA
jgi:hypothetical protein